MKKEKKKKGWCGCEKECCLIQVDGLKDEIRQ
jgi:hypothetical protein